MRNARITAAILPLSTTAYYAVGPFAAGESLTDLDIYMSVETAGYCEISLAYHPTPTPTAATLAAGSHIIEVSAQNLAGANSFLVHLADRIATRIRIPLKTTPQTHPNYIHIAVANSHATKALSLLFTATSESTPRLPGPAAQPNATTPPS